MFCGHVPWEEGLEGEELQQWQDKTPTDHLHYHTRAAHIPPHYTHTIPHTDIHQTFHQMFTQFTQIGTPTLSFKTCHQAYSPPSHKAATLPFKLNCSPTPSHQASATPPSHQAAATPTSHQAVAPPFLPSCSPTLLTKLQQEAGCREGGVLQEEPTNAHSMMRLPHLLLGTGSELLIIS